MYKWQNTVDMDRESTLSGNFGEIKQLDGSENSKQTKMLYLVQKYNFVTS